MSITYWLDGSEKFGEKFGNNYGTCVVTTTPRSMMENSDRDRGDYPPRPHGGGVGENMSGSIGGRPTMTTTTTTTTTSSPAYSIDWIKLDIDYFKTIPGILKLVQWVLGIFCMGFGSPAYNGGGHFYLFVVVLSFIITFFWICIYFFSIREGLQLQIPWVIPEFYYTAGVTLFYFLAFIVQFATGYYGSHLASAVFAMFNTVAYALGAFFLYKDWKQNTGGVNSPNV